MKGYLRKHQNGHTLTIIDNSQVKRHFLISSLDKFCKSYLKEKVEDVLQMKRCGQYIVNKLGFEYDIELDYYHRYSFS